MSNAMWKRASRLALTWCVAAAILSSGYAADVVPSYVTETDDFADVAAGVRKYAEAFGPERVLLVLDIDNTLLAMKQPLGSDQWFEWQRYLVEQNPGSPHAVATSFEGLLRAQGLLYHLGPMRPPQKDLPVLISRLQDLGVYTLLLTARGDEFRAATERELRRVGYDFAASALPVRDVPQGTYLPYDLADPEADGLTPRDVAAFRLGKPRPVSYSQGIMMTAGQNKGAMLLTILDKAAVDIEAVVFDDDQIRHIAYVFAAVASLGKPIAAFHYTREAAAMERFQYEDKTDVTRRWRRLNRTLEETFAPAR